MFASLNPRVGYSRTVHGGGVWTSVIIVEAFYHVIDYTGMKRGKVPPLVLENSQAVKEESVSQESDNGGLPSTSIPLPAHLTNDIPRSKFDHVTVLANSSTLPTDATVTRNLMSKFESVATETLESGKSLLSDKLNSTGSCDSQLSQARMKRRTTRREFKLATSQLLSTDVVRVLDVNLIE